MRGGHGQARAHALLPLGAVGLNFLDFLERGAECFASELSHLQVQERGDDRHQRDHRDVYQARYLLIDLLHVNLCGGLTRHSD